MTDMWFMIDSMIECIISMMVTVNMCSVLLFMVAMFVGHIVLWEMHSEENSVIDVTGSSTPMLLSGAFSRSAPGVGSW